MCKTLILVFYFFTLPMAGLFTCSTGLDELESDEQLDFCRRMIWIIYGVYLTVIVVALCWLCYRLDQAPRVIKCMGHLLAVYVLVAFIVQYAFLNHVDTGEAGLIHTLAWIMLFLLVLAIIAFLPSCVFLATMRQMKPVPPSTTQSNDSPPAYDDLFPAGSPPVTTQQRQVTVF